MSQSENPAISKDEAYDLLSNARRRFVISYLRDRSEPVALSTLSEEVAAWENETPPPDLTDQQIKRVYVSLYQTHLPKLSEAGLVDYDRDAGRVQLTSNVTELDTYLPERNQDEPPWQLAYVSVAIVGLALYLAAMTVPSLGISETIVGILTIGAFAVVAATHYMMRYR
jgi:DNA-binding transcriptional ArsR family regulator